MWYSFILMVFIKINFVVKFILILNYLLICKIIIGTSWKRKINTNNIKTQIFCFFLYVFVWKILTREWFYTTNHKKLGVLYILFSSTSAIMGTTLATAIRAELSHPGSSVFANSSGAYHIIVAIHAILMVFFVVTPIVFGGFGNYFLPVQVGARDVAYPRLNNFSVWLLPAGFFCVFRAMWDGVRIVCDRYITESKYSCWKWNNWLNEFHISPGIDRFENLKEAKKTYYSTYTNERHPHSSVILVNYRQILSTFDMEGIESLLPRVIAASDLTKTMAGWTFTTPFSHSRYTGRAVDLALGGLILATITSIFTTINLIASWRYLRGRGARYQKELFPIFLISLFIALRLLLIVSPILTAGFVMLIADRQFLTSFFTIRAGGDVLLFQHIFWFFGHPEVYILVIPGFGVTSTIIPYYTRKPISSKMHMVYAMHAIGSMSMVVWGHHMYLVGIDSKARTLFMTITIMIGLPSTIKICGWIISATNGIIFVSIDFWLVMIFVSIFFVGGMSGLMVAGAGLDVLLHDTYYVVGHFHVMLSGAMILSVIGWIYFNFREIFGITYMWLFAGLHLFLHVFGHVLCFIPMLWLGYSGMPRRVHDYPFGYSGWHSVASFGHSFVLMGLLSFSTILMHSCYFKRPLVPRNLGFAFLSTRCSFLITDKSYAAKNRLQKCTFGVKNLRDFFFTLII